MTDSWAASTHRNVACKGCHGSSLTADLRMHLKNVERVWLHARGEAPEQIHIRHQDVAALVDRCRSCHAQEYSAWKSGPHGATYARIFLDEDPQREPAAHGRLPALPRHALRGRDRAARRAHRPEGAVAPAGRGHDRGRRRFPASPATRSTVWGSPFPRARCRARGRRSRRRSTGPRSPSTTGGHRSMWPSPPSRSPTMRAGARVVHASPDRRQALCYQCHAPRAEAQVFSGDDRTPTGVHEGLSCLSCHQGHGQATRASCAGCHPRLSNCGLDVEKMDTTFRSLDSRHNVHSVACVDCHPKGVPKSRKGSGRPGSGPGSGGPA